MNQYSGLVFNDVLRILSNLSNDRRSGLSPEQISIVADALGYSITGEDLSYLESLSRLCLKWEDYLTKSTFYDIATETGNSYRSVITPPDSCGPVSAVLGWKVIYTWSPTIEPDSEVFTFIAKSLIPYGILWTPNHWQMPPQLAEVLSRSAIYNPTVQEDYYQLRGEYEEFDIPDEEIVIVFNKWMDDEYRTRYQDSMEIGKERLMSGLRTIWAIDSLLNSSMDCLYYPSECE